MGFKVKTCREQIDDPLEKYHNNHILLNWTLFMKGEKEKILFSYQKFLIIFVTLR